MNGLIKRQNQSYYKCTHRCRVRTSISTCQYSNYSIQITSEIQDVTLVTQEGQPTKSTHQNRRFTITIQASNPIIYQGDYSYTPQHQEGNPYTSTKQQHIIYSTIKKDHHHQQPGGPGILQRTKKEDHTRGLPHNHRRGQTSSVIVLNFVSYLI